MSSSVRRISGLLLFLICISLITRSLSASVGQARFFNARYGEDLTVDEQLDMINASIRLDPYNYRAYAIGANAAFEQAVAEWSPVRTPELIEESRRLMQQGIALNWYDRDFHIRKMGLLIMEPETRLEGLAAWQAYTDWEYWNPDNHYYLTWIHARLGNIEKAERELELTTGSVYFRQARQMVKDAKGKAMPRS